jgi:hypothetical protein
MPISHVGCGGCGRVADMCNTTAVAGMPISHVGCGSCGGIASHVHDMAGVVRLQTCTTWRLWRGCLTCMSACAYTAAAVGLPHICVSVHIRGGCGGVASHVSQRAHMWQLRQGCLTYVSACAYVAAAAGLPRMCVGACIRGGCSGVASHSCQRTQRGSCVVRIKLNGSGGEYTPDTHMRLGSMWRTSTAAVMVIKKEGISETYQ